MLNRFQKAAGEAAIRVAVLAGCAAVGADIQACSGGMQERGAEALYLAKQLECVDRANTRNEATACRNKVKAEWAAPDAGAAR